MILLDANILLRLSNKRDPLYPRIRQAVLTLRQTEQLVICPQGLFEFWAVATRDPVYNGLGMDSARTRRWINRYLRFFDLVHDPSTLLDIWTRLVDTHDIRGFRAHDARYVALMEALGIDKLLTLNARHFAPFGIKIIDPS